MISGPRFRNGMRKEAQSALSYVQHGRGCLRGSVVLVVGGGAAVQLFWISSGIPASYSNGPCSQELRLNMRSSSWQ